MRLPPSPLLLRLALLFVLLPISALSGADAIDEAVARLERTLTPIRVPERTIDAVTFAGHAPDAAGTHDFRPALQRALDELEQQGGGTLYLPHPDRENWGKLPVTYRVRGPLRLGSNTRLLLDRRIVVHFEYHPESYTDDGRGVLTRYEGTTLYGHAPLLRAFNAENVVIQATDWHGAMPEITGDGDKWVGGYDAPNAPRAALRAWEFLREVNNAGKPLRERRGELDRRYFVRPAMIQFFLCRNVLVEGVKLANAPFWVVHPVFSSNLTFRNLVFDCQNVNNDGIDPDSSRRVLIENIIFNNHDDNVAIKSGRDREGREGVDIAGTELEGLRSEFIAQGRLGGATEDVVVRRCVFRGHYAFCVGSEVAGGARRIYAVDNIAPQEIGMAVFIKSSRRRGGTIEDIHVRNLQANQVRLETIALIPNYDGDRTSPHVPTFRRITIENLRARQAGRGIRIFGWPESLTSDVSLKDIQIGLANADAPKFQAAYVRDVTRENVVIGGEAFTGTVSVAEGDLPPAQN